jgi:CheY-like chemotaxis protein
MPEMDGYQLAGELRRRPGLGDLRLVALSGLGRDRDRDRATAAGFASHLLKPLGLDLSDTLIERLRPNRPRKS